MPNPIGDDRQFVINTWRTLYGVNPDAWTLDHVVSALQAGSITQEQWSRDVQGQNSELIVQRIFKEVVGADRDANDPGIQYYAERMRNGMTAQQVRDEMANSSSVLLRNADPNQQFQPSPGQESSRDYINAKLRQLGLDSLSDWAWEEIRKGSTPERVLQDLRDRPEYKARFPGMDLRRQNGLMPIDEGQYLESERRFRDAARRFGLPPGFYDDPSDYTALIAGDVSPEEYERRLANGWARIATAPPSVRATFAQWFGAEGDTALAAWFIDPDKAESLILKAAETARMGGFATLFGLNVSQGRANELYDFGKNSEQVVDAYNRIGQIAPLFQETISETQDYTGENEGLSATLGLDATSQRALERRGRTRTAATSGGGGALIGQQGLGAGSAEG